MGEEAFNTKLCELQDRVKSLTDENGILRRERDWAREYVMRGLPKDAARDRAFVWEILTANPGGQLAELILELEAEVNRDRPSDPLKS